MCVCVCVCVCVCLDIDRPSTADGSKRAVLLSGPPGIGKSSAAAICAKECGYGIVEMNASDARSKKLLHVGHRMSEHYWCYLGRVHFDANPMFMYRAKLIK